jgi:predicted metal-binding protein
VAGRTSKAQQTPFLALASRFGALGAKVIAPSAVQTGSWVRWKCQFGCGGFGSSLMCPPRAPKPAETRTMLDGYKRALLFEAPRGQATRIAAQLERELFLQGYYRAFGLGAGPCDLCETCAFDEGCRHPREARPAMEACGIDVFATARKHGFAIDIVRSRRNPQHYFGLVLID